MEEKARVVEALRAQQEKAARHDAAAMMHRTRGGAAFVIPA